MEIAKAMLALYCQRTHRSPHLLLTNYGLLKLLPAAYLRKPVPWVLPTCMRTSTRTSTRTMKKNLPTIHPPMFNSNHNILSSFSSSFQNVHKNRKYTHALLESASSSCDILFIQEAHFGFIHNTISTASESGDPILGPVHHVAWECLHKQTVYENSLICVYINKCILHNFTLHTDPHMIPHEDILTFTLTCIIDNSSALLVCIYNRPSSNNSAIHHLIDNLHINSFNPSIIQGDLNLHSSEWDPTVDTSPDLCVQLLNTLTLKHLLLINDDGQPTWHHNTHTSRVLDLIFAHGSLLQDERFAYQNNIDDRGPGNHSLLNLFLGSHPYHYKQAFIAKGSNNEFNFTRDLANAIINILGSKDLHDAQHKANDFSSHMNESWIDNSRSPTNKGNPNPWWNRDCQSAKEIFEFDRSEAN